MSLVEFPPHLLSEPVERWAEWAGRYSAAQLNQGLWALFSYPCFLGPLLFDADLPLASRARAMRSLVVPYRDYVAGWNPKEEMPNGWFMLWHMILKSDDRKGMDDVALDCLEAILALSDARCQSAALHGLNHLRHPNRPAVVQRWIDLYGRGWNLEWLEACRDGAAL